MELRVAVVAAALAVAGLVLSGLSAAALGAAKAAAKWPAAGRSSVGVTPALAGVSVGAALCGVAAGFAVAAAGIDNEVVLLALVTGAGLIALAAVAWGAVRLASRIELSALINSPSPSGGNPQGAMPAPAAQQSAVERGQSPPELAASPNAAAPGSPSAISEPYLDASHTTANGSAYPATRSEQQAASGANLSQVGDQSDPAVPGNALPGWVYTDEDENWYLVASIPQGRRLMRLEDFAIVPQGTARGPLTLAGSVEMTVWPAGSQEVETEERPAAEPE